MIATLAQHLQQVYTGGNWTTSNLKDTLEGVDFEMATRSIGGLNTIAALVYHMNYYCDRVGDYLLGGTFNSSDKESWNGPEIKSEADWAALKSKALKDGEKMARAISALNEEQLSQAFVEEKYGTYLRNVLGIIEHFHYHLGQIVIIKRLLDEEG